MTVVRDDPAELSFHLMAESEARDPVAALADAPGVTPQRAYATVAVKRRLHQQRFRELVVSAYQVASAMCRLRHGELLDTAHILADRDECGRPEVPNGLCLCKVRSAPARASGDAGRADPAAAVGGAAAEAGVCGGEVREVQGGVGARPRLGRKPIRFPSGGGGSMSWRMASKTTVNWPSYFFSSAASLRPRSSTDAAMARSFTNARMISTLTAMARGLRRTLDSMATPCSVKA